MQKKPGLSYARGMLAFFLLAGITAGVLFSGCENSKVNPGGKATVIRVYHHLQAEMDPHWRSPVTGEPLMGQEEMNARLWAEQQVLEKFNVQFSWLEHGSSDPVESVLRGVFAGDPPAELVRMAAYQQGPILSQNVLQPLDEFANIFEDEDSSWLFLGKVYGHHYFLDDSLRNGGYAPLMYNIGMLKEIPALRENGKLVLPVDLWLEGRWTWSAFEDYLQKIRDFYTQRGNDAVPYSAHYSHSALQAMHSNGAGIYGENGFEMDTPQAKDAVAYIERLISKNLIGNMEVNPVTGTMGYDPGTFRNRGAVFNDLMQWWVRNLVPNFVERGDTMGIVPFPRPDRMAADDPNYGQLSETWDCYAVPRGIDREMTELTLRAFREYMVSYYSRMANSDHALDFLRDDAAARSSALNIFLDITDEEYGEKILDAWKYLGSNPHKNEFVANAGLFLASGLHYMDSDENILGAALAKVPGIPNYAVHVEAKMPVINELMNNIQRSLDSTGIVDNIPPRFADIVGMVMAFPAGTAAGEIDWKRFLSASDNIDGEIDFLNVAVDASGVNFSRPGKYENAAFFVVRDAAGNETGTQRTVIVFDGTNTAPPTLTVRNGYRTITLNEDTAAINWKDDFVESAIDKDGLDIKGSVFADLSELNTTVAGSYAVTLSARDFAGNETSAEITVNVE